MSQFHFGVSTVKVSRKAAKRIGQIAREHDCAFIEASVMGACRAEGLLPDEGRAETPSEMAARLRNVKRVGEMRGY